MSLFNLTEEEKWQIESSKKEYPLDPDWYKFDSQINSIILPYILIGMSFSNKTHIERDYNGLILGISDKDDCDQPFKVIQDIRKIIYAAVEANELEAINECYDVNLQTVVLRQRWSAIVIIDWIEREKALDPSFPLSFPEEAVNYIKKRNENQLTFADKMANYPKMEKRILDLEEDVLKLASDKEKYFDLFADRLRRIAGENFVDIDLYLSHELYAICVGIRTEKIGGGGDSTLHNKGGKTILGLSYDKIQSCLKSAGFDSTTLGRRHDERLTMDQKITEKLTPMLESSDFDVFRSNLNIVQKAPPKKPKKSKQKTSNN